MTRVGILAKSNLRAAIPHLVDIEAWLADRGIEAVFETETARLMPQAPRRAVADKSVLASTVGVVVVLGGDGTLLGMADCIGEAGSGVPILGVNFGGLGFMTELQPEELYTALTRVLRGAYEIEEREALRVRFRRGRKLLGEYALLNDAVVTKTALARMLVIELRIDNELVATYTSDGLIIATPTGSTAYNLSAGGPILDPRMSAFVIAPICPHAMSYRPLVVPGSVRIEVTLRSLTEEAYLTLDGQVGFPMKQLDAIVVDRHPRSVRLLRVAQRGFFEVLQRKLHWGDR